jgi:hypothetical protein
MKTAFAFIVLAVIFAAAPCLAADTITGPQAIAAPAVAQSIPPNVLKGSSTEFVAWLQHSAPTSPTATTLDFAKLVAAGCSDLCTDCCCVTHPPRCFCC